VPVPNRTADLVVRANVVHTFDDSAETTAFAVQDGVVVATSGHDEEAGLLRAWTGWCCPRSSTRTAT
jgi:predicted amidohydrolase YtcJ